MAASSRVKWVLLLLCLTVVAWPAVGYAQDAVLTGTVTDATGGVLPGVTVTAVNEATGNTFVGVTDGTGAFRIPARVGAYRMTAELSGFTTVQRTGVQLLVGQTISVDLQMNPSTIQETVTVTAASSLSSPSLISYVKVSTPTNPSFGVYSMLDPSMDAEPDVG